MDDAMVVAVVGQVVVGAMSAWAGAHKGVADLSAKVAGLTDRVGRLEVVVGLRGVLRSKDAKSPYPEAVAALVKAEGPRKHLTIADTDPTPPDGTPSP